MAGPGADSPPDQTSWYAAYTASGAERRAARDIMELGAAEAFLPITRVPAPGADPASPGLLFNAYVFFRAAARPDLFKAIAALGTVRRLLGPTPDSPDQVPPHDIALLRQLCELDRHPVLGALPEEGMTVRVVDGPLAGSVGVVVHRGADMATVSFPVPILAGAFEISIALDLIKPVHARENQLARYKKRHRGGRRQHRGTG